MTSSGNDMKKIAASLVIALLLNGCATSHYTSGKDFPSANVPSIVKGKTTTNELEALFGQPFAKSPVNETDEKWVYTYINGSAHAQSYIFTMKVTNAGTQKTLDVLIRNNAVINYTFTEGPSPGSSIATE
jgi:outer membrane protein assembly factor BamE (lipoprotein component of BamABCDE complex)